MAADNPVGCRLLPTPADLPLLFRLDRLAEPLPQLLIAAFPALQLIEQRQ